MPDMRKTDVAIVGGGIAGSTAAAMLGRAGIRAVLIDPHPTYPPELRCEKLGGYLPARTHTAPALRAPVGAARVPSPADQRPCRLRACRHVRNAVNAP